MYARIKKKRAFILDTIDKIANQLTTRQWIALKGLIVIANMVLIVLVILFFINRRDTFEDFINITSPTASPLESVDG